MVRAGVLHVHVDASQFSTSSRIANQTMRIKRKTTRTKHETMRTKQKTTRTQNDAYKKPCVQKAQPCVQNAWFETMRFVRTMRFPRPCSVSAP